jgi:hypothetical protein
MNKILNWVKGTPSSEPQEHQKHLSHWSIQINQ